MGFRFGGIARWFGFGLDPEPATDEFAAIHKVAAEYEGDWNWPSRGHKVRPTNGRRPRAPHWTRWAGWIDDEV